MAIVINGSGTVTGLAVGGLPDATVDAGTLASGINKTSITDGGNATAITINSSENVGIGTANPAKPLHIMKTAGANTIENLLLLDCNVDSAASGKGGSIVFQDIAAYPNTAEISASRVGGGSSSEVKIKLRNADMLVLNSDGRGLSQFTAKAWINWDNTGTLAILDSHNVSSVTDNAVGNGTVVLANNMANVNYCASVNSQKAGGAANDGCTSNTNGPNRTNGIDVHTLRLHGGSNNNGFQDVDNNFALLFGD